MALVSVINEKETVETARLLPKPMNVSGVSYTTHGICPGNFQVSGRSVFDSSVYVIDTCELQGTRPDL